MVLATTTNALIMGRKCTVQHCTSGYNSTAKQQRDKKGITLYSFPHLEGDRQSWVDALPNKLIKGVTKHIGVCSLHWPKDVLRKKVKNRTYPAVPPSIFPNSKPRKVNILDTGNADSDSAEPMDDDVISSVSVKENDVEIISSVSSVDERKGDIKSVISALEEKYDESHDGVTSSVDVKSTETKTMISFVEEKYSCESIMDISSVGDRCYEELMSALRVSMKSMCNNKVLTFARSLRLAGHLYLTLDTKHTQEIIIEEELSKTETCEITLVSKSTITGNEKARQTTDKNTNQIKFEVIPKPEAVEPLPVTDDDNEESSFEESDVSRPVTDSLNSEFSAVQDKTGVKDNVSVSKECPALKKLEKENPNKEFTCDVCHLILNGHQFQHHLLLYHQIKVKNTYPGIIYSCVFCHNVFQDKADIFKHVEIHASEEEPYKCENCPKTFTTSKMRKEHQHEHERMYACEKCGKHFRIKSLLKKHRCSYLCSICKRSFTQKVLCDIHEKRHNLTKWFICDVCGKEFKQENRLVSHLKTHSDEQPFLCSQCGKTFVCQSYLKIHIKEMHSCRKPFVCPHCGKIFYRRKNLLAHENTHTKPYSCMDCGKQFSKESYLTHHSCEQRQKPEHFKYSCKICQKPFSHKQRLLWHSMTHSVREKKCRICHKSFPSMNKLKRHELIHSGVRPFSCKSCGKSFTQKCTLKAHENLHLGIQRYSCKFCSKTFSKKMQLAFHEQNEHNKGSPEIL